MKSYLKVGNKVLLKRKEDIDNLHRPPTLVEDMFKYLGINVVIEQIMWSDCGYFKIKNDPRNWTFSEWMIANINFDYGN